MKFLSVVLLISMYANVVNAIIPNDNQKALNKAIDTYTETVGSHSLIFQGVEQLKYPLNYLNTPYFIDSDYSVGDIWYQGVYYPHIMLRFDMYRNQVIVRSADQPYNIVIFPQKLDSAMLHGYKMVYLPQVTTKDKTTGAYCLRNFSGKVNLFTQPEAVLREFTEDQKVKYRFERIDKYYIEKSGILYSVNNLRSFYKLFPQNKKQIIDFAKNKKLNFRKNPTESMVEILKNLPLE